jgi:hypothetical protein
MNLSFSLIRSKSANHVEQIIVITGYSRTTSLHKTELHLRLLCCEYFFDNHY